MLVNSRILAKINGTWVEQNTPGFYVKVAGEFKNVIKVYEKVEGEYKLVNDQTILDGFDTALLDGASTTFTGSGTIRLTVRGYDNFGGRGGDGGLADSIQQGIRRRVWGGDGGGGGGAIGSTGALAVSEITVSPGDVLARSDSAGSNGRVTIRLLLNGDLVCSAEGAADGIDGTDGLPGSERGGHPNHAQGGGGGHPGEAGGFGRASESFGNVSIEDGTLGTNGRFGGAGTRGHYTAFGRNHGEPGKGGDPNGGDASGNRNTVGRGGSGRRPATRASVKIEALS